jgi:hypothetical protein
MPESTATTPSYTTPWDTIVAGVCQAQEDRRFGRRRLLHRNDFAGPDQSRQRRVPAPAIDELRSPADLSLGQSSVASPSDDRFETGF